MNTRFRKVLLFLLLLCSAAFLFAQNVGQEADIATQLTQHSLASGNFNLHYVDSGDLDKPIIVFIHETPVGRALLWRPAPSTQN